IEYVDIPQDVVVPKYVDVIQEHKVPQRVQKYQDKIIEEEVFQTVEKVVEVPQIETVERYIEIPREETVTGEQRTITTQLETIRIEGGIERLHERVDGTAYDPEPAHIYTSISTHDLPPGSLSRYQVQQLAQQKQQHRDDQRMSSPTPDQGVNQKSLAEMFNSYGQQSYY
ncbi:hypothetical protein Pmar_PMAR007265, partial [Perkinsus marinus ATCC 50983]